MSLLTRIAQALKRPQPKPKPQPRGRGFVERLRSFFSPQQQRVQQPQTEVRTQQRPQPTATPEPQSNRIDEYLRSKIPSSQRPSTTLREYYPAYSKVDRFAGKIEQKQKLKGLRDLMLLQAFYESTLGRGSKSKNLFGLRYGGTTARYPSFEESISDYRSWLSGERENVYVYPLTKEAKGAITARDIEKLYGKGYPHRYGPPPSSPSYYLPELLEIFTGRR